MHHVITFTALSHALRAQSGNARQAIDWFNADIASPLVRTKKIDKLDHANNDW